MQPSESAFDRVKSLLGKMDRSIDEARERRLREDEDGDEPADADGYLTDADSPRPLRQHGESTSAAPEPTSDCPSPDRPTSKYGRATPIRDLSGRTPPAWREA